MRACVSAYGLFLFYFILLVLKQAWHYVALVDNGFYSSCHSKADGSAWTASPGASACHCTEKLVASLCCNQSDVITDFLISSLHKLKLFSSESICVDQNLLRCLLYLLYMMYLVVMLICMLALYLLNWHLFLVLSMFLQIIYGKTWMISLQSFEWIITVILTIICHANTDTSACSLSRF